MSRCWSMSQGSGHNEYFIHLLMSIVFSRAYKAWSDCWPSPQTPAWADGTSSRPWSMHEPSSWWSPAAAAHGSVLPAPMTPRWRRDPRTFPLKLNRRKTWWEILEMTSFCAFLTLLFQFQDLHFCVVHSLSDRRLARSFGEAEEQRDAFGEKAWMATIGMYKLFDNWQMVGNIYI